MTWVKVCGLRTDRDVETAAEAGADAIGLVLAPSSRQVGIEAARRLADRTDLLCVLVTADLTPEELLLAVEKVGAGGVQPHGTYAPAAAAAAVAAGLFVLHPIGVADEVPDLDEVPIGQIPLLDTHRAGTQGGTGVRFDWRLIPGGDRSFVLAGGLGPDTIAEAVDAVHPWGVDASSGLESSPGVKNHDLIRMFVKGAKA